MTGTWTGIYSWNCGESLSGSTSIAFDLVDDGTGNLTGTASYLGGSSVLEGKRILDGTPDEFGQISGPPHPEGMFVLLQVPPADGHFIYNEFDGAVSPDLGAINGDALNGDSPIFDQIDGSLLDRGCSAPEHPTGSFAVEHAE